VGEEVEVLAEEEEGETGMTEATEVTEVTEVIETLQVEKEDIVTEKTDIDRAVEAEVRVAKAVVVEEDIKITAAVADQAEEVTVEEEVIRMKDPAQGLALAQALVQGLAQVQAQEDQTALLAGDKTNLHGKTYKA